MGSYVEPHPGEAQRRADRHSHNRQAPLAPVPPRFWTQRRRSSEPPRAVRRRLPDAQRAMSAKSSMRIQTQRSVVSPRSVTSQVREEACKKAVRISPEDERGRLHEPASLPLCTSQNANNALSTSRRRRASRRTRQRALPECHAAPARSPRVPSRTRPCRARASAGAWRSL